MSARLPLRAAVALALTSPLWSGARSVSAEDAPGKPVPGQPGEPPPFPPGPGMGEPPGPDGPGPGGPGMGEPRGPMRPGPNQDGPWNHRVMFATSKDGMTFAVAPTPPFEKASVPELFEGPDGRAITIFVDASDRRPRLAAAVEQPDGSWKRADTNLDGVDPNVVRLEDGTYRAFMKEGREGAMASWTSSNGLTWTREGVVFQDENYPYATDPDVFHAKDGWVMLVSIGPKMVRATSADGHHFETKGIVDLGGSVSDTVAVEDGWRTYFHVFHADSSKPGEGGMRIRSAFTLDGVTWRAEDGDRLVAPAEGPASRGVADPAPLRRKDGSWLMAFKSFMEPRGPGPDGMPGGPPGGPGGPMRGRGPLVRLFEIEDLAQTSVEREVRAFVTGSKAEGASVDLRAGTLVVTAPPDVMVWVEALVRSYRDR
jgi:hypothetical protein